MKPYPKYKPSDIQWLGNIPEHWKVKKLKYYFSYKKGRMPKELKDSNKANMPIYLSMDYLRGNPKQIFYVKDFENTTLIEDDDILLLWDGSNAGEFMRGKKGVLSSTMALISTKVNLYSSFCWYLLKASERILKESTIGMGIPHVDGDELNSLPCLYPPLPEQTAIAQFLDQKTAQIDMLIAQKQRLITLLKEERMAFINEILSDESFPLKKLKYVVDLVNQKMSNQESTFKIALENIESGTGRIINLDVDKEFEGELRGFEKDDILFSKLRPYLCKVYLAEKEGTCVGELLIFRPKPFILPKFLFYKVFSQEFINAVDGSTYGTKMPRASWEDFISHQLIPCPPLETQQKIVESIETTTDKIDATLAKIMQEIELLKEYRVALISEVVTGKVSVISEQ